MISTQAKIVLFKLIKDQVILIDSDPKKLDRRCKELINIEDDELAVVYKEGFDNNYLTSYDSELTEDNVGGGNSKLLMINIKKIFEEELFSEFREYKELKEWYIQAKETVEDFQKKSLFLAHIDSAGYANESTYIMKQIEKIDTIISSAGDNRLRLDLLNLHINNIELEIENLPNEYNYGIDLFSAKEFYKYSILNKSDILSGISRNDECPCGSGKKFKKCCLNY